MVGVCSTASQALSLKEAGAPKRFDGGAFERLALPLIFWHPMLLSADTEKDVKFKWRTS